MATETEFLTIRRAPSQLVMQKQLLLQISKAKNAIILCEIILIFLILIVIKVYAAYIEFNPL